uniref:Crinkler family protein n=1 Tax=Rhizophagus irregularis (strain DAOM 181602 / DAOM 197198 / MUCL 43194) TaxID=747089 RepID=U9SFL1_RHIID
MDEITLNCLIVPIGKLMNIPCVKVMQAITVEKDESYIMLEATIQSRLGVEIPLKLCIIQAGSNSEKNLAQLESAFQTNKKKRTADQAFRNDYFDYLYGIMSTGTGWHFIMYTPDGIYSTSSSEYQINLTKSAIKKILITSKQREG